jgi:ABC-type transport system involved in multi-copper enzyme maturation permease subunit
MVLGGLVMLSVTIAGGTRLSTLANGALAFMLYGLAFIGGWVEQIGALFRNETAVDLGIVSSLIMPADVLWRYASTLFQPMSLNNFDFAGPFIAASQPHERMVIYAVLFCLGLLGLAMWLFTRRDL